MAAGAAFFHYGKSYVQQPESGIFSVAESFSGCLLQGAWPPQNRQLEAVQQKLLDGMNALAETEK